MLTSAIRQAYLQNGGNDPDILHQMAQMQAEAQNIEDQMKKHGYDRRHRGMSLKSFKSVSLSSFMHAIRIAFFF